MSIQTISSLMITLPQPTPDRNSCRLIDLLQGLHNETPANCYCDHSEGGSICRCARQSHTHYTYGRICIIMLSRVKFHGCVSVNDITVQYPPEFRVGRCPFHPHQESDYPKSNGDGRVYKLSSVICYSGNAEFGHYIAYVRRQQDWYCCNSLSGVTKLDNPDVVLDQKTTATIFTYIAI